MVVRRRLLGGLLALLLLAGNAAMVQAVAWATMLASRSASLGWSAAVESTFSGAKPCHLCLAAKSLREQPQPTTPAPEVKLVVMLAAPAPVLMKSLPPAEDEMIAPTVSCVQPAGHSPAPEPPPPRHC